MYVQFNSILLQLHSYTIKGIIFDWFHEMKKVFGVLLIDFQIVGRFYH